MAEHVREPIQTYLNADERAELDRVAGELQVSRSEVLRRGIRALGGSGSADMRGSRSAAARLPGLTGEGVITPPSVGPGEPPPSKPVAPLAELLAELEKDRGDR